MVRNQRVVPNQHAPAHRAGRRGGRAHRGQIATARAGRWGTVTVLALLSSALTACTGSVCTTTETLDASGTVITTEVCRGTSVTVFGVPLPVLIVGLVLFTAAVTVAAVLLERGRRARNP